MLKMYHTEAIKVFNPFLSLKWIVESVEKGLILVRCTRTKGSNIKILGGTPLSASYSSYPTPRGIVTKD